MTVRQRLRERLTSGPMIVAPGIYDAFGARFVEMKSGPTILENLKRLTSEADAPCLVNMGAGGKLDELTPDDIGRLGLRIAIYPGLARAAAGFAIREALSALRRDGNTRALRGRMLGLREYNEALKLDEVEEWERRYLR